MDLKKASILLDTINALFKRLEMNGGNMPAIERDLMLQNIRELYEFFVTNGVTSTNIPASVPTTTQSTTRTHTTPTSSSKPAREVPSYNTPEPAKTSRKVERNSDYRPPRIIEIPPELKEDTTSTANTYTRRPEPAPYVAPKPPTPAPEPVRVVEPTPPPPSPKPTPVPTPSPSPTPLANDNTEFDTLFEHKAARELSEKLSERPIADLTRAVGYNDKMLYTNELFGGELVAFNSAVSRINSMGSFTEARKHLAKLAEQHNWTAPNKTNSAKRFIKLIRRRFGA